MSAPYNNVGAFEMVWTPLPGPEEEDAGKEIMDVETEDDLIGKPWTYRFVLICTPEFIFFVLSVY